MFCFSDFKKTGNLILFSILVFNIIGLFNEFFQNHFQGKPIFILENFLLKI